MHLQNNFEWKQKRFFPIVPIIAFSLSAILMGVYFFIILLPIYTQYFYTVSYSFLTILTILSFVACIIFSIITVILCFLIPKIDVKAVLFFILVTYFCHLFRISITSFDLLDLLFLILPSLPIILSLIFQLYYKCHSFFHPLVACKITFILSFFCFIYDYNRLFLVSPVLHLSLLTIGYLYLLPSLQVVNPKPHKRFFARSIHTHVILSILTLGIYQTMWTYCFNDKINSLKGNTATMQEMAFIMTVPFYSLYWLFKKATQLQEIGKANHITISIKPSCYVILIIYVFSLIGFLALPSTSFFFFYYYYSFFVVLLSLVPFILNIVSIYILQKKLDTITYICENQKYEASLS